MAVLGLALFASAAIGCSQGTRPYLLRRNPILKDDRVVAPATRVEQLNAMAADIESLPMEKQEEICQNLADQIAKEEDAILRAAILRAIAKSPTEKAAAVLRAATSDPDPEVRIACYESWGKRTGDEAVQVLSRALVEDREFDARMAAARGLGATGSPKAMAPLANSLEETDPAMQYRLVQSLKEVSGQDFGTDTEAWRQYAQQDNLAAPEPTWAQRWLPWMR